MASECKAQINQKITLKLNRHVSTDTEVFVNQKRTHFSDKILKMTPRDCFE
jgi:hypothetical protein